MLLSGGRVTGLCLFLANMSLKKPGSHFEKLASEEGDEKLINNYCLTPSAISLFLFSIAIINSGLITSIGNLLNLNYPIA
jgi:hypothetical protein